MPTSRPLETMNVNGRKPPRYVANPAAVSATNAFSRSGSKKSLMANFLPEGGRYGLSVKLPTTSRKRRMNAVVRIVQPKPISGMRRVMAMGRITPPIEEPETTRPRARARWVVKYVGITAIAWDRLAFASTLLGTKVGNEERGVRYVHGKNKKQHPNALHTLCARKNW